MTDIELLRRVRHGDEQAFHELVDRHADHLFGVAYSLVGNAADAEDVVQETLAAAFRGVSGFREQASVKTWLLRILVRQCARVHRGRFRDRVIRLTDNDPSPLKEDEGMTIASSAVQADARLDVSEMLSELSPEHREVIVLRELEGFSYEEMAQTLGVPQGTVESRLHRARAELRQRFKGYL